MPVRLPLACLFIAALAGARGLAADAPKEAPPLKPGVTEGAETRLIQFELRATRKGAPVRDLSAKDLDIELGGKPLRAFTIDNMCSAAPPPEGTLAASPGSFLFYFDEPELTFEGRLRAVDVARHVAPALIARGHDVMILRNGATLRQETTWTHDAAAVAAALDRIAADPGNRDYLRSGADEQKAELLLTRAQDAIRESEAQRKMEEEDATQRLAGVSGPGRPVSSAYGRAAAAGYGAEGDAALSGVVAELTTLVQNEVRRSERDIERLRGAVLALSSRGTPKGAIYFADTLRRDPGGVVARTLDSTKEFANRGDGSIPGTHAGITDRTADAAITALVRDAATYGVRFYAVEGRGLGSPSDWVRTSQDTLAGLALETGGLYFVNGVAAERIADGVTADQSCWYLVSFDPAGWAVDKTLPLAIYGKQPGLRVQARSALVIPSKATLQQIRLLAAHLGDPGLDENPLPVSFYPVGGTAKELQVLAQVRLPDNRVPQAGDSNWEVGFQLVSGGTIVAHTSNRVTWKGNGPAPICQSTMTLPAGPFELVAVARELASDSIREGRMTGTWPAIAADHVVLSLPVLAQPQRGGIVKDGEVASSGIVVRGTGSLVDPRLPLAIVTAACVDGPSDAALRADRKIVGENEVPFAAMTVGSDDGRCVQIRDLVKPGTLGAGHMTYVVDIRSGETTIASQQLEFLVADGAGTPAASAHPGP